jgi:hypothetical protein
MAGGESMTRRVVLAAVLVAGPVRAAPDSPAPAVTDAAEPCVNREATWWRAVRDPVLDAGALRYCTGADCWTLDLASNTIAAAPPRPSPPQRRDRAGELTDEHGAVLAAAGETQVAFCPGGEGTCQVFDYRFDRPALHGTHPVMNTERTLGAVIHRGDSEAGEPSFVLAYDLVHHRRIGQLRAHDAAVLGHGFLIDETTLYSASLGKLGALAAPDQAWERLGTTSLLALHDTRSGAFVIQDARTGKVKARIAHGVADKAAWFQFVASPDGATLYAIGSKTDEGEVLTVNVAAGKVTRRASPVACAAGTHRIGQ